VRLAASRSAGRIKTVDAAREIAGAVKTETDATVKEQQVRALGEIGSVGSPAAHDTLAEIAELPGRIGVIAAGSLLALGDAAAKAKLEAAVAAPQPDLRLAAMQAASAAHNPVVISTLLVGAVDRVFDIRLAAAEGLSSYGTEKATAVPILTAALTSRDVSIVGRAVAALTRLGEKVAGLAQTPADMLDAKDPRQRLAVVGIVRAMPAPDALPLLRRLIADPDPDVRRAGVDAIEDLATKDKDAAIKLYKPLVADDDPIVRSKAAGQLSRLVAPPPPASTPVPATPTALPAASPAPDDALTKIQPALDATRAADADAKRATDAALAIAADLTAMMARHASDDATLLRIAELKRNLEEAATKLDAAAARVEAAARTATDAGGATPSPDAARLVAEARALAQTARTAATAAHDKATTTVTTATELLKSETSNITMLIATADAAIATGNFPEARRNLEKAAKQLHDTGGRNLSLDYSYAQLYDRMAMRTSDPATKRKLFQQAEDYYRRFTTSGSGPRVRRANDRRAEIAEELKDLPTPP
jgi:HEAT repeat protein